MNRLVGLIYLVLITATPLLAQKWEVKATPSNTQEWQVSLSRNGVMIFHATLDQLIEDSLLITASGNEKIIPVNDIVELRSVRKSKIGDGALEGAKLGGIIGAAVAVVRIATGKPPRILGIDRYGHVQVFTDLTNPLVSVAIGACAGLIVGGVVGTVASADEVHDMAKMPLDDKLKTIQKILSKEK